MEWTRMLVSLFAVICVSSALSNDELAKAKREEEIALKQIYADMDKGLKGAIREHLKSILRSMDENGGGLNISSQCRGNVFKLLSALRDMKPWAVSIVDASGKLSDGVMSGNLNMFGNYDQCLNTTVFKRTGALEFRGQYCLLSMAPYLPDPKLTPDGYERIALVKKLTQNLTELIRLHAFKSEQLRTIDDRIGLCVPSGCHTEDVKKFVKYAGKQLLLNLTLDYCHTEDSLIYFTPSRIAILCIFSFYILLATISSVIERYSTTRKIKFKNPAMRGLLCFSLPYNFHQLMSVEVREGDMSFLNGLRVLSLFWVILGHHYTAKMGSLMIRNALSVLFLTWPPRFSTQMIVNGTFAVEVFFFVGGFLNCYIRAKKNWTSFSIPSSIKILIHRLMRIYPVYIISILLILLLNPRGPMAHHMNKMLMEPCKTDWWKNVLFINNFYGAEDQCIPHSWYLAVDMQYFLVSLLTIPLLFRCPKIGVLTQSSIILVSIAVTVFRIWGKKLAPTAVITMNQPGTFTFNDTVKVIFSPLSHAASYFGGVLLGFYIVKRKSLPISKTTQILGWIVANTLILTVLFYSKRWNSGHPYTRLGSAFYYTMSKCVFSWSVGWIIYCCIAGQGGIINSILSWKVWIPLNRLCLSAYLLSLILQEYFFGNLRSVQDFQTEVEIWGFFGDTAVTCLFSVPVVLLFEFPFIGLEKVIFHKRQNTSEVRENEMNGKEIIQHEKDVKSDNDNNSIKI